MPTTTRLAPTGFYEALDDHAETLNAAIADGSYVDGHERTLAAAAVAGLTVDEHPTALAWLVLEHALDYVLDCQLDETADATYALAETIADATLGAIRAEGAPLADVLLAWTTRAIDEAAALLRRASVVPNATTARWTA